jgi:hypothetical protein
MLAIRGQYGDRDCTNCAMQDSITFNGIVFLSVFAVCMTRFPPPQMTPPTLGTRREPKGKSRMLPIKPHGSSNAAVGGGGSASNGGFGGSHTRAYYRDIIGASRGGNCMYASTPALPHFLTVRQSSLLFNVGIFRRRQRLPICNLSNCSTHT